MPQKRDALSRDRATGGRGRTPDFVAGYEVAIHADVSAITSGGGAALGADRIRMKWLKIGATIVVTAATFGWLGYDLGRWWTAQTLRDRGMEALKESRLADAQHFYIALDSLGDREADFWLGQINVEGYGVPINHDRAIYWFARAPEPKPDLYLRLGHAYEQGDTLPKNQREASFWYHQAALLGSEEGKRRYAALNIR